MIAYHYNIGLVKLSMFDAASLYYLIDYDREHLKRFAWAANVTVADIAVFIVKKNSSADELWGILHKDFGLVGCIEARSLGNGVRELGYWLGKAHIGKGYLDLALEVLMTTFVLGRDTQLIAKIRPDNERSRKRLVKAGLTLSEYEEAENWMRYQRKL